VNTFLAVTVAWSFAFALFVLHRLFRCKHDWEPLVERELPSKAEILKQAGQDMASWVHYKPMLEAASKVFFAIIGCKKCGATREFRQET